jgi:hypothetical protein
MTTNSDQPAGPEVELLRVQGRLVELEAVCERLWPAVRFFLLGGAHPRYVDAVCDLARLLGKTDDSRSATALAANEVADKARAEAITEVAAWIQQSIEVRGVCGGSGRESIAKLVERLRTRR